MKETEKIKCWVVFCEDYPKGLIFPDRADALDFSSCTRECGGEAYTRVAYYTKEEFEALPEAD